MTSAAMDRDRLDVAVPEQPATIGLLKRQSEPSVAISLVQIEEYYYFSC